MVKLSVDDESDYFPSNGVLIKLKCLSINNCIFTNSYLELPDLIELEITSIKVKTFDFNLANLRILKLTNCDIRVYHLLCTNLMQLSLINCGGQTALDNLINLTDLTVENTLVSGLRTNLIKLSLTDDNNDISHLTNLTDLHIDFKVDNLSSLINLTRLSFNGDDIELPNSLRTLICNKTPLFRNIERTIFRFEALNKILNKLSIDCQVEGVILHNDFDRKPILVNQDGLRMLYF